MSLTEKSDESTRDSIDTVLRKKLIKKAAEARELAYAPYTDYKVGAAVLTVTNKIYTGCNVETVTLSPTICAERNAIFKAVSDGEKEFVALAVVTANGATPCGVCRQVMREFSNDLTIFITSPGEEPRVFSLSELLPHSFGPEDLDTQ